MTNCFDEENGRSAFGVLITGLAVSMFLVTILTFVWEFDLATSPEWQVGLFHLMLAVFLSMIIPIASLRLPYFDHRFQWFMISLPIWVTTTVFITGWMMGDTTLGFRDDRIFDLVVASASAFMLIWMGIAYPMCALKLGRAMVRYWRHGLPGETEYP